MPLFSFQPWTPFCPEWSDRFRVLAAFADAQPSEFTLISAKTDQTSRRGRLPQSHGTEAAGKDNAK